MRLDITPVAFEITVFGHALNVYWYALTLTLAYIAGTAWAYKNRRHFGFSAKDTCHFLVICIVGGLWGARLAYCARNWGKFAGIRRAKGQNPFLAMLVPAFGLTQHGGVIGSALLLYFYCRLNLLSIGRAYDFMTTPFAIGLAFGRVGCFFQGCCHGKTFAEDAHPTVVELFGVQYPLSAYRSFRWTHHKVHDHDVEHSDPIHPSQLYEVFGSIALIFCLNKLNNKEYFLCNGQFSVAFLVLHSLMRLANDFFRYRSPSDSLFDANFGSISDAQLVCYFVVVLGTMYLRKTYYNKSTQPNKIKMS